MQRGHDAGVVVEQVNVVHDHVVRLVNRQVGQLPLPGGYARWLPDCAVVALIATFAPPATGYGHDVLEVNITVTIKVVRNFVALITALAAPAAGYGHDVHDVNDAVVVDVVGATIALVPASTAPFTCCLRDVGNADRAAASQSDEA